MTSLASRPSSPRRATAIAEIVFFVGSILVFIWLVQPVTGAVVHVAYYLLMLFFAAFSAVAHGAGVQRLGLRIDNFPAAARQVLPATVALVTAVALAGWVLHSRARAVDALAALPPYFAWALVQQYALQGFVQQRLWDAGLDRDAPLVAAGLFSLAHIPNPALVVFTFIAGWMWASAYRRCPNLFALALSHALLAVAVVTALPSWFTAGLRVGPGYWHR